jgi:dTDP-4-dehydrorhamnose 3,5-epimerase
MKVVDTHIPDIKIIEPDVFGDDRGYFFESFAQSRYQKLLGINDLFVQDNISCSQHGVLRGLHYQTTHPQGKLVYVLEGKVFDVAVDIRLNSPTFGKSVTIVLSQENKKQLYIPKGFAHGFFVMSKRALFAYKCTDYYYPDYEMSIYYEDPELAIDWPQCSEVILSKKDAAAKRLSVFSRQYLPTYKKK